MIEIGLVRPGVKTAHVLDQGEIVPRGLCGSALSTGFTTQDKGVHKLCVRCRRRFVALYKMEPAVVWERHKAAVSQGVAE